MRFTRSFYESKRSITGKQTHSANIKIEIIIGNRKSEFSYSTGKHTFFLQERACSRHGQIQCSRKKEYGDPDWVWGLSREAGLRGKAAPARETLPEPRGKTVTVKRECRWNSRAGFLSLVLWTFGVGSLFVMEGFPGHGSQHPLHTSLYTLDVGSTSPPSCDNQNLLYI